MRENAAVFGSLRALACLNPVRRSPERLLLAEHAKSRDVWTRAVGHLVNVG